VDEPDSPLLTSMDLLKISNKGESQIEDEEIKIDLSEKKEEETTLRIV
jgi:hypothetical protein